MPISVSVCFITTLSVESTYTLVVVAADNDAIAVDGRSNKTRAGSSCGLARRAAEWVSVARAGNLNCELELHLYQNGNHKIPLERPRSA